MSGAMGPALMNVNFPHFRTAVAQVLEATNAGDNGFCMETSHFNEFNGYLSFDHEMDGLNDETHALSNYNLFRPGAHGPFLAGIPFWHFAGESDPKPECMVWLVGDDRALRADSLVRTAEFTRGYDPETEEMDMTVIGQYDIPTTILVINSDEGGCDEAQLSNDGALHQVPGLPVKLQCTHLTTENLGEFKAELTAALESCSGGR